MEGRTKPGVRRGLAAAGTTVVVAVTVIGGAALAHGASAAPSAGLFPDTPLGSGMSTSATVTVPSADHVTTPYMKALAVRDACASATCPADHGKLSQLLLVSAVDPAGQAWTGSFAALQAGVTLPGGPLTAHANGRPYRVTLTLPATATNADEGLSLGFTLEWGGQDASGNLTTAVLGEAFSKSSGNGSSGGGTSSSDSGLPFTGSASQIELGLAGVLLLAGASLSFAGRPRRRRAEPGRYDR